MLKEGMGEDRESRNAGLLFRVTADTPTRSVSLPTTSAAHEGRPEQDLRHHRRHAGWPPRTARSWKIFRKKGIEVLLLTDRVDEWMLVTCYGVRRQSRCSRVAKGAVDLGKLQDEAEKKQAKKPPRPSSRCSSA